jgi:hypothetical protein
MLVVNLFAGPGVGKSAYAAGLFHALKTRTSLNVELVQEYAKELVWRGDTKVLKHNQALVFAGQLEKILMLDDNVSVAITDSPLDLGLFYHSEDYPESFDKFVLDICARFNTIDFFIPRKDEYWFTQEGRIHSLNESKELDQRILGYLKAREKPFHVVQRDDVETGFKLVVDRVIRDHTK